MSMSQDARVALEKFVRASCNDQTCRGFFEKFVELNNSGQFQAYLQNQLGIENPDLLLQDAIQGIQATRFNGIDKECIDAVLNNIISRLSKHWP